MSADRTERRVVVADDDVWLREGIAGVLERAGFEIAGQVGDAEELLRVVRDQPPNLVIVDFRMPPWGEAMLQHPAGNSAFVVWPREHVWREHRVGAQLHALDVQSAGAGQTMIG